jgi:hypothetical protein
MFVVLRGGDLGAAPSTLVIEPPIPRGEERGVAVSWMCSRCSLLVLSVSILRCVAFPCVIMSVLLILFSECSSSIDRPSTLVMALAIPLVSILVFLGSTWDVLVVFAWSTCGVSDPYMLCTCGVLEAYWELYSGCIRLYCSRISVVFGLYTIEQGNPQASKCPVELPVAPCRFLFAVRACECCTRCWVLKSEYVGRVGVRYWFAVEMCGLSGFC